MMLVSNTKKETKMKKLFSTFAFKKVYRATKNKTCNYSNNYYGDQICKSVR